METRPQGKSMRELRAIVERDRKRFREMADVWDELLDDEQDQLMATARAMIQRSVEQITGVWEK